MKVREKEVPLFPPVWVKQNSGQGRRFVLDRCWGLGTVFLAFPRFFIMLIVEEYKHPVLFNVSEHRGPCV